MSDLVSQFLAYLRAKGRSPLTLTQYQKDLAGLPGLNRGDIRQHLAQHPSQSPSSRLRRYSALRSLCAWCIKTGMLVENPMEGMQGPKTEHHLPWPPSVDEVAAVLARMPEDTPLEARDKALFEFLYASGCRAAEVCNLELQDLDMDGQGTRVTGKGNKTRVVVVGSIACEALRLWLWWRPALQPCGPWCFCSSRGGRLTTKAVHNIIKRASRGRFGSHKLRHAMATHLVDHGCGLRELQELLGHERLSTTCIYAKVSQAVVQREARFHPRSTLSNPRASS